MAYKKIDFVKNFSFNKKKYQKISYFLTEKQNIQLTCENSSN